MYVGAGDRKIRSGFNKETSPESKAWVSVLSVSKVCVSKGLTNSFTQNRKVELSQRNSSFQNNYQNITELF